MIGRPRIGEVSYWSGAGKSDNDIRMRVSQRLAAVLAASAALVLVPALGAQAVPEAAAEAVPAPAAEAAAPVPETVFAPFPSKLRAAVRGDGIILTWIDSADVKGSYIVYRSTQPIVSGSLESADRLAIVDPGVQAYTDKPGDSESYYYLVLALAEDGSPYQVFIPAKNATAVAVSVDAASLAQAAAPAPAAPAVESPAPAAAAAAPAAAKPEAAPAAPERPSEPFADALSASIKDEALILSYKAPAGARLVLYRGTGPIRGAADLLDATLVAAFADKGGSFADYPVPGVQYYYALLGEEDLKAGIVALFPGRNTLEDPVGLKAAGSYSGFVEVSPNSRTPPLPFLIPDAGSASGFSTPRDEAPPERTVAPDTRKAIDAILAAAPSIQPPMPELSFLPEELSSSSGGEDYALSVIVKGPLSAKDWDGAVDQLRKYLSLNRGAKAGARAHFYLGQALAFTGEYRDSFFEFLSARELYASDAKAWIEFVLSKLKSAS